jgi:cytochrome P450
MQRRLREEIRSNIASFGTGSHTSISAATIDGLPYLNAVCNEVLRFYPSVALTIREAAKDTTILDTFIPKGTVVTIAPNATNHNPDLWGPDAGEFNPDRWIGPGKAKNGGAESNYAFLTFIHGPRSCIGQGFSKAELACLVAVMVGRFEMELENPDAELKIKNTITASPKDGVMVKLKILER